MREQELIEALGQEEAIALMDSWGGRYNVYIPQYPGEGHALAEVISQESIKVLVERWGGTYQAVPKGKHHKQNRDEAIAIQKKSGLSNQQIAQRFGITRSRVRQILKEQLIDAH